jgi:fructose/tagatose bisphosphate aldolase
MALYRNVRPLLMDQSADRDTALDQAESHLKKRGMCAPGDTYAITCGEPMGRTPAGTNMLKICRMHRHSSSMRQLLDHAAENGYGIPAFNVNNLEQVQAVMEAAKEVGAPVILQASAGARKYAGEAFIKHLIQAAIEMYPASRWSCTRTTARTPTCARAPSTWASAR